MNNLRDEQLQRVRAPWWSSKEFYYRRPPPTDENVISEAQLENRIRFARASISARGEQGYEDGLPISAATVREQTKKPAPEITVEDAEAIDVIVMKIHRIVEDESEDLKRRLLQIL